jgi:hypothetical protein
MHTISTHPEGEEKSLESSDDNEFIPVDTFGGRVHVKWDSQASLTPLGQVAFFVEFLKASGLFDRWVEDCPAQYTSPNAPKKRDVLGTILLSVLAGHKRYSHMTNIRCDNVNPGLLSMSKVVSEDAVRRMLKNNIEEIAGDKWLRNSYKEAYGPLLTEDWILDVDTTVKPLYGKQEGAVVGYNPHKPGRPSHTYHTYMMANIKLILDVDLHAGNESASKYTAPGLWSLLDSLPQSHWPSFMRGDIGFGTDGIMSEAERIGMPYLFKLKQSKNVKHLIDYCMLQQDWEYAGHKWEGIESKLQLMGWGHARRVIVLRRQIPKEVAVLSEQKQTGQMEFHFVEIENTMRVYEYAVLVTSLEDEVRTIFQHYRERSDCENNFDELKNQWGWSGFTTHDVKRSAFMARIIGLIYNWWTLFVRSITPGKHTEAITSRPLLLHAVGRQTKHAGQTKLVISSTHGKSKHIHKQLAKLSLFLKSICASAEQLSNSERLRLILSRAFVKYLGGRILKPPNILPTMA